MTDRVATPAADFLAGRWSATAPTTVGETDEVRCLGYTTVGATLVSDLFTDTNGTALTAHTPDTVPTLSHDVDIDATGGTWDLTIDPPTGPAETLSALAWDITAATLQTSLETLSFLGSADVTVTGGPGGTAPLVLTWETAGSYAADLVPTVTTNAASLTGGAGTATVTANAAGWALAGAWTVQTNRAEIQAVTADAVAIIDAAAPDVRVSVDVTWGIGAGLADEHIGLVVRGASTTEYLRLVPRGGSGTKTFRLEEDDGTVLATFPVSPTAVTDTGTATLEADLVGNMLTFRIGTAEIGTHYLTGAAATTYGANTQVGIYSNEQDATPDANFDNVTVTRLNSADRSEVQSIAVDATGGTYTISDGTNTTAAIPYNDTAADVETALGAATPAAISGITVAGGPGDSGGTTPYYFTWTAAGEQTALTTDPASLTGGGSTATVTEEVKGWTADDARLEFTSTGIIRYFNFRPTVPVDADELAKALTLKLRSARTGAGYLRAQLGVLNSQGNIRWASTAAVGTNVAQTGVYADTTADGLGLNADGYAWDVYDPTRWFVKLLSATSDSSAAFGTASASLIDLTVDWSDQPTVTLDTVDVAAANPVVEWTYTHVDSDDTQQEYQVMVWDPADITADPDANLEDVTAVYDSGRVTSEPARAHRIGGQLDPAFTYTYGVRAWAPDVAGRDQPSEWATSDAATPGALDSTVGVSAVASADEVTVTITNPGTALRGAIERSIDNGATYELIERAADVTGATEEATDSFDRANGGLGNEEGPDTLAWSVEAGTTGAIESNQAKITGVGHATVDVGAADVRVSALVDITRSAGGVVARRSAANGYVLAWVDAVNANLYIWDEVASAEHTSTPYDALGAVAHDVTGDTLTLELVVDGDEYVVAVNGRTMIRLIDATVDADIVASTEVGISGANTTGDVYFDDFDADGTDGSIVYVDRAAPQSANIVYRATLYHVSSTGEVYRSAAATSTAVSVTDATWRLTSRTDGTTIALRPENKRVRYVRPNTETRYVAGRAQVFGGERAPKSWRMSHRTLTEADYDTMQTLLDDTGRLTLADVFGNSWSVRWVGEVTEEQIVAPASGAETSPVGHRHLFTFELQALR